MKKKKATDKEKKMWIKMVTAWFLTELKRTRDQTKLSYEPISELAFTRQEKTVEQNWHCLFAEVIKIEAVTFTTWHFRAE